jgi:hypothetical protein
MGWILPQHRLPDLARSYDLPGLEEVLGTLKMGSKGILGFGHGLFE